jgi:glucose/arabinose dehydrogenase
LGAAREIPTMRPALLCLLSFLFADVAFTQPADLALVPHITNVASPMGVRHAGDGSQRLFVVDRYGKIWIRPTGAATGVLPTPFLDISSGAPHGFSTSGEGGFLGLAFDPHHVDNRLFYVHYTSADGDATVVRYSARADNANVADPASATVVLRVDQDTAYHRGGDLQFGLDGYLYISLGDGGGGNSYDGCNRAQTLNPAGLAENDSMHGDCPADGAFTGSGGNPDSRALMGKILRIDVSATTTAGDNELCGSNASGSASYAIPPDNPFAASAGGTGNCDEIWAYGLRNPYRFSIDRANGDLYIGDVGESAMEEIDHAPAGVGGLNFGWDRCEGTLPTPGSGSCSGFVTPILAYTHEANAGPCAAVTGGVRYRGSITGLRGRYVYADYCSGKIHIATENGGWSSALWQSGAELEYTGLGEDEQGELYLAATNRNTVYRFASDETGVRWIVTPEAGEGGTLAPAVPQTVNDGETVTFLVTPDANHLIGKVSGCGGTLMGHSYTTAAVTADCTVAATFVPAGTPTYVVTPDAGAGGTLSPSVAQTVTEGHTTDFIVAADEGFRIGNVGGCDGELIDATYTTAPATTDCTVTATFIPDGVTTHIVTPDAGPGGTLLPAVPQTVADGDTVAFTVTTLAGYLVDGVAGCGGHLDGAVYTTADVVTDCTVTATFLFDEYLFADGFD